MNLSEARCILQFAVNLVFVAKLGTAGTMFFELDSNLELLLRSNTRTINPNQNNSNNTKNTRLEKENLASLIGHKLSKKDSLVENSVERVLAAKTVSRFNIVTLTFSPPAPTPR